MHHKSGSTCFIGTGSKCTVIDTVLDNQIVVVVVVGVCNASHSARSIGVSDIN